MNEKQLIEALVKSGISEFISDYLPTSQDDLEDCWNDFLTEFRDNKCNGFYGYYKPNQNGLYFKEEALTLQNLDSAIDYYFNLFKKIVNFESVKQINEKVTSAFEGAEPFEKFLSDEVQITFSNVTMKFSYEEEEKIPLLTYSNVFDSQIGVLKKISMLGVTCSDEHVKNSDLKNVLDNAIHYNLECIANENNCPSIYKMTDIHIVVDHLNYENTLIETVSEESNNKTDAKIYNLTQRCIKRKFENFLNAVSVYCKNS